MAARNVTGSNTSGRHVKRIAGFYGTTHAVRYHSRRVGIVSLEGQSLGIYRVGPELGRGGMGVVYRGESTADGPAGPAGSVVALKIFHPHLVADERAFERFEREAEIGQRIRHPHVVRTFGVGEAEIEGQTQHYMVMELIEGQTLKDLLAELGTVPEHLLFQIADQALDALEEIHASEIVHRDIKPENIVITPDHRVLLMDLGVARLQEEGQSLTRTGEFVGSLAYAAPEQFGTEDEIGPRADLYAFGAVLYELATGKNPFDTEDLATLLQQKVMGEVQRPRELNPDVPAFWDEVVYTCLDREPARRFTGAEELRAILQEGERSAWWHQRTAGRPLPGAQRALERLRLVREVALVGREIELERLRESHRAAQAGSGRILLLGGGSGVGKSRLVYNFVEELSSAAGPLVVAGRAAGPSGRAYQPFVEAAHDLLGIEEMELATRREQVEAALAARLPATPGVVSPLAAFLLAGLTPGEESGFTKDAVLSSLANLFRHSANGRALVMVIEDLQLAGSETLELFGYLARNLSDRGILLVGVYGDDEVEEGSELQALLAGLGAREGVATLELRPLARTSSDDLLQVALGHEPTVRALGSLVHEKSDGNPHIILEMVAHLRASGVLVEHDDELQLVGDPEQVELPSTVTDLINLKLSRLDEEQRETLEAAAVLGHVFEASLLAAVLEERRIKLLKRLAVLERKYRLIESSGKDSFRFAKRQIQEALYQHISPALRSEYHSVVADAIEENYVADGEELPGRLAFALLYHLHHAERALEGEPYVEQALEHLAGNYHASFATPFLEHLAADFSIGRAPARFAVAMGLWTFYEMLGRNEDQRRVLEEALRFAEEMGDAGKRGQVHSCLAVSCWRVGDPERAAKEAEQGVALAREAGDRRWEANSLHTQAVVAFGRAEFRQCDARVQEALEIKRDIGDRRGEARSLQVLAAVMRPLGEHQDKIIATQRDSLKILREIGDRRGECALLNNLGNNLVDAAQCEEGLEHFERAAQISRELGDLQSEAFPLSNSGRALSMLGRYEEAVASLRRALDLFREVGFPPGELGTCTLLGSALAKLGEQDAAETHLERAIEVAEQTGARIWLIEALRIMGGVLHGRGERDRGWECFARALEVEEELQNPLSRAQTLGSMGAAALREKDHERAVRHLEEALQDAAKGEAAGHDEIVWQSRLARALGAVGRTGEAEERADLLRKVVEAGAAMSPVRRAEVYFNLRGLVRDEDVGRRYVTTARELVESVGRSIRNGSYREHFLKKTWPNDEILEEAERLGA
jgi:tetratricopeptide (TPR) repeat protein/predicted Ser/Thr protein kinase